MIRPLLWLPMVALSTVPAFAQTDAAALEKAARKLHAVASADYCEAMGEGFVPDDAYLSWTFDYIPSWGFGDPESVTLIRIFCGSGAYNVQHAYYWHRNFDGLQPLALATPTFTTVYEDVNNSDSPLLELTVTGIGATMVQVNSEFDPETLTISSHSLWRGVGDASTTGIWGFEDGEFSLRQYDIDASYDGEVNPERVVDYSTQ